MGAKVEALDATKIVKAVALTNAEGNYTLSVPDGTYQIRATASGFQTQLSTTSLDKDSQDINLTLEQASSAETLSVDQLAQTYYNDYLQVYSESNDSKILLAVVDIKDGQAILNTQEIEKYRQIVYSNQMLYDLLREVISAIPVATGGTQGRIFTSIAELEFEKTDDVSRQGSLVPVTITVNELKEQEPFSVILAPIVNDEGQKPGIQFVFGSHSQTLRAYIASVSQPYDKTFVISGCDPNLFKQKPDQKVKVVYWVIAGSQMGNVRTNSA